GDVGSNGGGVVVLRLSHDGGDEVAVVMVDLWWGVVEMSGGMEAWVREMEADDGDGGMCRSRW
nr:hypothetical protein [Tanacetum cinerariifolium]GFA17176.1 hypothetical protein [Tanacetum cinerariifolium]